MIRVAVIGGLFHSGGKKTLVMEYYRHIDRTKVQMDLICNSDSNSIPYDEWNELGGCVYVIPSNRKMWSHLKSLYKILKQGNYDIVHGYDNTLNVFAMVLAKWAGINVRINESLSMAHKGELKTFAKMILKKFSKLCSTHYMANGVEGGKFQFGETAFNRGKVAVFKSAINVAENGYNESLRNATREKHGWQNNVIYGFIGRFEMQKNPLFMIRIFNEIAKRQENARLVIIGHGSMEDKMMSLVEELGIGDRVENLGRTEDIKQYYNAFDAFLLPSLYEGLPVVGVESQACGLPIFFSDEIPPESSACEMGRFISLKESPAKWAEKIIPFVNDNIPVRRSYSQELIQSGFDSNIEAAKLLEYYMNAIKE